MSLRIRRIVLLLLLLVVPFQGVGAAVHAAVCAPGMDHAAAAQDAHAHDGHDHGARHDHSQDSGAGSTDHASHQCCHHFSSAAAPAATVTGRGDLPVFQSSISLLETLFFPEQPQRPPRS